MYGEEAAQRGLLGAAAARAESAKQQHRAKLNHRARAERGEPVASRRPFGWNADKVTLHAGEAEVVRRGVQSLLHGKTLTAVTQLFVDSGYPSTLGNPWQRQTVKQLLRNPRLCGYRKLDGVLVRGSNGEPVLGLWEPIVSPDEWHAVSEMLERQRHPGGWARSGACPPDGTRYLLTGLVRCGRPLTGRQCGALMHGHPTRTSYEYRCRGALDGGCGRVSRQGPAVDVLITEYALARLDQQGTRSARSTIPWPGSRQLEISRQSKAALQQRWYAGEMTDAEYFSHLTEEESRIKRLVNEQQTWLIKHQPSASDAIEARAYWTGLSMSAQREVLIGLLESVLILPGTKGSHRFEPTAIVPVWRSTRPDTQPT
jgi:hypothetical protein